jgi:hypothetical protein
MHANPGLKDDLAAGGFNILQDKKIDRCQERLIALRELALGEPVSCLDQVGKDVIPGHEFFAEAPPYVVHLTDQGRARVNIQAA